MSTNLKVTGHFIYKETCKEIETALGSINNIVLSMHLQGGEWSIKSVGKEEMPDILIYEIDGNTEEAIQDLEKILQEFSHKVDVIVTYQNGDMDTMRRLMKAGVRDAFPQPIQIQELVNDVTNIFSNKRARLSKSKGAVTSFISAKGGSGATTIAVNVAEILASSYDAKVLLIDLDIQFGDAGLLLDLKPTNNVLEALLQPNRVDSVFLDALITKHESGLDVLTSPADISPMGGISPEGVTNVINAAAELYDFVILDVPRVLTSWTMTALRESNPVLVVGENNISSIRDTKLLLDRMAQEGIRTEDIIEVINNRAMSKDSSIPVDKLKETLGIERIRKVSNDHKVAVNSQSQGRPVEEVSKRSDFTKNLKSIAEYIYVLQKGEDKKKDGLFSKLFS